ncbi:MULTISPECIES: hypothetical protein [unclassified Fibrobacter]|uniref:hypothetical protein n=1 Tax=unclassified Fibrobacter TaxID=2634177 RepID=UPI000D6C1103|nr:MULTISPECIES: hypothetical protein [unclassified Fibrobacter]PWJ61362.1 hypothetical protein BGX12_12816 [Fibrobacter sp. UWR4]PZW65497.1 hypothetical protein C8E88_10337 [Fibrobacter sp. UWR1]
MSEQILTRESLVEFFGAEEYTRLCRHEAGHALVAFLFKRPLEYVKMVNSKERPGITRITGSELDGSAHIAIAGHISEFIIRKEFACNLDTVMRELPMELNRSDADYQSFQAACYYFQLAETNVVEQCYNILMACQKSLLAIVEGLEQRTYLSREDIENLLKA